MSAGSFPDSGRKPTLIASPTHARGACRPDRNWRLARLLPDAAVEQAPEPVAAG